MSISIQAGNLRNFRVRILCQTLGDPRRESPASSTYSLESPANAICPRIDGPAYRGALVEQREPMLHWYMETCDVVPLDFDDRW